MSRARLVDIDRAKGLAITLVVLGHLSFDTVPSGNEWYQHLNDLIYKFHMAFFMYITGFLMFYTYPVMRTMKDYWAYVKKKTVRIIPAYVLFALLIIVSKTILNNFGTLENPATGFQEIIDVFLYPTRSCCGYLWYIYTVLIFYLTIPLMLRAVRQNLAILLVFAFVLYFLPRSDFLGYGKVSQFMFVFLLGGYAFRHRTLYLGIIDRYYYIFLALFLGCTVLFFVVEIPKLLFGLVAIPALHSLVRRSTFEKISILAPIGRYVFPIYLLNVGFTGSILFLLQEFWSLDGIHFRLAVPFLFLCGLLAPIISYEIFIKRMPVLKTIIRV